MAGVPSRLFLPQHQPQRPTHLLLPSSILDKLHSALAFVSSIRMMIWRLGIVCIYSSPQTYRCPSTLATRDFQLASFLFFCTSGCILFCSPLLLSPYVGSTQIIPSPNVMCSVHSTILVVSESLPPQLMSLSTTFMLGAPVAQPPLLLSTRNGFVTSYFAIPNHPSSSLEADLRSFQSTILAPLASISCIDELS